MISSARRIISGGCLCAALPLLGAEAPEPAALYHFDEGAGTVVRDASPGHHDGELLGGGAWGPKGVAGGALVFNGRNRVRIPSAPELGLGGPHSVTVWIRGRASATHFVSGFPDFRAPYFQVCGDTIYLATNGDTFDNDARKSRPPSLRGRDNVQIYTGTADISLGQWSYVRRTFDPHTGFEPKLQVVGDRIHYEYSGRDDHQAIQIWTASSARDGSGWRAWQRTSAARLDLLPPDDGRPETMAVDHAIYRVDHGAIAVAAGKLYLAYPAQDGRNVWQLWTGLARADGEGYRAVQRTTDHGWIPSAIQVVGGRVYYLFPKGGDNFENYIHNNIKGTIGGVKTVEGLYVGSTDLAGGDWRVLRRIGGPSPSSNPASFQISSGRIYLVWSEFNSDGSGNCSLYTGEMGLDGNGLRRTRRTFTPAIIGTPITSGLQVVGNRIYTTYGQTLKRDGRPESSLWVAECGRDGSGWTATCIASGSPRAILGYKGLVVVGAKRYLAPARLPHAFGEGLLGFGGANIVSKGDAYGVGVTEEGLPRAFVNAGQDYLFRGEAAADTAGAIADGRAAMNEDDWHQIAEVYDGSRLSLYVDGEPAGSSPCAEPVGQNPFPLEIGDGFIGAVDEVALYSSALSAPEVARQYHRFR